MADRTIKIVHCLNQYMPAHMAGTEVYTHTLALLQKQAGHDVSVLIPHFEYYHPGSFESRYEYEGLDVFQYRETSSPMNRDIIFGRSKPEGLKNFRDCIDSLKPDLVHFHELNRSIGLGTEHVKEAKLAGAKIFLTMHLSGYTCNTNILINHGKLCGGKILDFDCTVCSYKTLFKIPPAAAAPIAAMGIASARLGITGKLPPGKLTTLLSMPVSVQRVRRELGELAVHADQIISLTEWYKKILLDNGVPPDKITVIPQRLANTPPEQSFLRPSPGWSMSEPAPTLPLKLVFIGRIQPQKGVDLLIDAVGSFTGQLTLDIYGKPEETEYYRECSQRCGAFPHIRLQGMLDRGKVLETLAGYDAFCLPSTFSEMSPLVIQEAFAAGIPVIASEVYGNKEQVTHGKNGLLFAFNSVPALKEQLQGLVENPARLREMKKNITPPDTFKDTAKRYEALIKHLFP